MKYYRVERLRQAEASLSLLTREEMVEATKLLCEEYGLPQLPVHFSDTPPPGRVSKMDGDMAALVLTRVRRGKRVTGVKAEYIWYGLGMMTALAVAHEVAHYVRLVETAADIARGHKVTVRRVTHDFLHADIVDRGVALLRKAGYAHPLSPSLRGQIAAGAKFQGYPVTGFKLMANRQARQDFFNSLDPVNTPPDVIAKFMNF